MKRIIKSPFLRPTTKKLRKNYKQRKSKKQFGILTISTIGICFCASSIIFLFSKSPSSSSSSSSLTVSSISILEEQLQQFRSWNTTLNNNINIKNNDKSNDNHHLRLCFVTCEFADSIEHADILPSVDKSMRRNPPRHFVYTNLPNLPADGWQRLDLPMDIIMNHHHHHHHYHDETEKKSNPQATTSNNYYYNRTITQSRWGKFLAFLDPRIINRCDVVFYGDAYLLNPINETYWQQLGQQILAAEKVSTTTTTTTNNDNTTFTIANVGLMQNKQPYTHDLPQELRRIVQGGKDTRENIDKTRNWFRKQPYFRKTRRRHQAILVYKNALFGYNPHNRQFQSMVLDFWNVYSKEEGSWRDQPYWAYFLSLHRIRPIPFPKKLPDMNNLNKNKEQDELPFGELGKKGHGGHVYVVADPHADAAGVAEAE